MAESAYQSLGLLGPAKDGKGVKFFADAFVDIAIMHLISCSRWVIVVRCKDYDDDIEMRNFYQHMLSNINVERTYYSSLTPHSSDDSISGVEEACSNIAADIHSTF